MTDPTNCKVCNKPTHKADGFPIGEVHIYQRVDGKLQPANDLVLGVPMLFVHESCEGSL